MQTRQWYSGFPGSWLRFIGPKLGPKRPEFEPGGLQDLSSHAKKMCNTPVPEVNDLKQCLIDMWSGMQYSQSMTEPLTGSANGSGAWA